MTSELGPTVLVVEDENVVAMDLVSCLEKLHYRVVGVTSTGEEAIELARSKHPALVLMDIHLRGKMDGIAAAQQIQASLFIPVVYLTAYSDKATLERARVTQPFGYVLKPFDDREIEVAIQIALYRHKLEHALRDSEKRLDAILGGIGDAVIATDTERRITFLNRAAETLLGWSSERARSRLLSDVLRGAAQPDGTIRFMRGTQVVPLQLVESPVLDASEKPTGYVTIASDASERLRLQEAHDREIIERAARAAADKEHARARLKSEISLSLADMAEAAEPEPVLRRLADLIVRGLGSWCVLHVEHRGCMLRIGAHEDAARGPLLDQLIRRWPQRADAERGASAIVRTGTPELVEAVSDELLLQLTPDLELQELLRKLGITSYLGVPLRARQRIMGALVVGSSDPGRPQDDSDLAFAQQVGDRIAIAFDNARLFREAQEARLVAERLYEAEQRARAEAEALFRVADALTEAQLNLEALVQRVTDEGTKLVGANFGAFFYNIVSDQGESFMLHTLSGASKKAFEGLPLPRNTPLFAPTFGGEKVVRIDDVRKDARYGALAPHHGMPPGHLPVTSYLAVPVVSRSGPVIGGLFFGHSDAGQFTEQHEHMVKALAAHAAVAIDNARLFAATRDAEERQGRLVRELERTVRFSEMFVGILGHDLRNPLAGITTGATLIIKRGESERTGTPARRVLNSAARMSRMIDQILDFTRARLGRGIPLQRKIVDLAEVCRGVLDELKCETEDRAAMLEVRGDPVGNCDEDRVAQLVSNLAGNAIQHRRPGTKVTLLVDGSQPDQLRLEFLNDGVIPPEMLPLIFEPLRGGEQRREGSSGLGFGLYISQQIAVAHGGLIRVESEPAGAQTRFTVELPRDSKGEAEHVFNSTGREQETS